MMSELDDAHAAMAAGGDAAMLEFYRILADLELFVLLERDAEGDSIEPRIFDLAEGPVLLAFDSEDRLALMGQGPLPYAALPGRIIARQLLNSGVSLGLNLGTGAASETLLPPEALHWLVDVLDSGPKATLARPRRFLAPQGLPDRLHATLRDGLAKATGLAEAALLAGVQYDDGRLGHILAFVNAHPEAESALAQAMAEALVFSGLEAGELDVTFLSGQDPALPSLQTVALRFDVPRPAAPRDAPAPAAPGTDPARPPILR